MNDIFKYGDVGSEIKNERRVFLDILETKYEKNAGGILSFFKNADYPIKGMPTPVALNAANIAKKLLLEPLKLTKNPLFFLGVLFTNKEKLITSWNEIAWRVMSPFILKEEYRQDITNELDDFIYKSLKNYGITGQLAIQTAQILSHVIEYDGGYRTRLQDMFSMSTKDRFLEDIEELCKKSFERDAEVVAKKTVMLGKMLKWLLRMPKIRRAVEKAFMECNYDKLKFDKGDYYWALQRIDYNVGGYNFEERMKIMKNLGLKFVPLNVI